MNGFCYLVLGLDYKQGDIKMSPEKCEVPPCPMAIPVTPQKEQQPQYARFGFETIQTDEDKWQPKSIGGMEFPSHETARHWLDQTKDGANFKNLFKYVFVARVRG
jgi:hypothetical protein